MRLGIFGGSFNPPHNMHKKIALDLINNDYLDKIIYVPTGDKYQKDGLVSAQDRYNMIKIMINDNPNLLVSDYEITNELTYTYQTLDYFKKIYPNDDIYFICGSDNLKQIETWKNYEYILKKFKILVINRDDINIKNILKKYNNIILTNLKENILSSTYIRNLLKEKKYNCEIDDNVLKYILQEKIYRDCINIKRKINTK